MLDADAPAGYQAVIDLSPANSTIELPMDLILGYPTLRQAGWLLDFPSGRWTVMDPSWSRTVVRALWSGQTKVCPGCG